MSLRTGNLTLDWKGAVPQSFPNTTFEYPDRNVPRKAVVVW